MGEDWLTTFSRLLNDFNLLERQADLTWWGHELLRWNKTHNLTAYGNWSQLAMGLMADGLQVASFCQGTGCLDIGSGAGFPALMIALARPEMAITSLEARRKRVSFQRHVCRHLAINNVQVVWGRAGGQPDPLDSAKFNTITCQALASLPQALAACRAYVQHPGLIVLPRGIGDLAACQQLCAQGTPGLDLSWQTYQLYGPPGGDRLLLLAHTSA